MIEPALNKYIRSSIISSNLKSQNHHCFYCLINICVCIQHLSIQENGFICIQSDSNFHHYFHLLHIIISYQCVKPFPLTDSKLFMKRLFIRSFLFDSINEWSQSLTADETHGAWRVWWLNVFIIILQPSLEPVN